MKKLLMVMSAMVVLGGCAGWRSETTCKGIEARWGEPAKIIENDNGTVTYHWFFEESHHGAAPFTAHNYWVGYEFVCDKNGKIISKKTFYPQPKIF